MCAGEILPELVNANFCGSSLESKSTSIFLRASVDKTGASLVLGKGEVFDFDSRFNSSVVAFDDRADNFGIWNFIKPSVACAVDAKPNIRITSFESF